MSEGCDFCKGPFPKDYTIKPCGNGDLNARAELIGTGIVLFIDKHTASGYFDVLFCPICGRKLVED